MDRISQWIEKYSLYGSLAAAWVAMLGSLYFSQVRGYAPCLLCWYQRGLMYPLALILAVGLLLRTRWLPHIVLPISLFGIGLSSYHYLLQKTMLFPASPCGDGPPCTTIWINWFGFVTIPFLALTAFFIITIGAAIALAARGNEDELEDEAWPEMGNQSEPVVVEQVDITAVQRRSTPWLPVGGTIAAVMLAFALIFLVDGTGVSASDFPTAESTLALSAQTGAQLYADACAACHGVDLAGVEGLGNALANNEFVASHASDELLAMIRAGRAADDPANEVGVAMPPSGGRPGWSDAQLLRVIDFIREWQE